MKIYEEGVVEYLKQAGVSDIEIARIKQQELKIMVLQTLDLVEAAIRADKYDRIPTEFSPAGDDMGRENTYISFNRWDIGEVIEELTELKKIIDGGAK